MPIAIFPMTIETGTQHENLRSEMHERTTSCLDPLCIGAHFIGNDESVRVFGSEYPRTIIINEAGTIVFDRTGGSVDAYKDVDSELDTISRSTKN